MLGFCYEFNTKRLDYGINLYAFRELEQKTFVRGYGRKSNFRSKPAQFGIVIAHLPQNTSDATCVSLRVSFDFIYFRVFVWSAVEVRFESTTKRQMQMWKIWKRGHKVQEA